MAMDPVKIFAIPETHFARIMELLEKSDTPVLIRGNDNIQREFTKEGESVFVRDMKEPTGEFGERCEVLSVNELPELRRATDPVFVKLREEHPDMTDEELDIEAENIKEISKALETIVGLGVDREVAIEMIKSITENDIEEMNSAEALAKLLETREKMFGKHRESEENDEE